MPFEDPMNKYQKRYRGDSDDVISFESWKQLTSKGFFSPRSSQLRAVDAALEAYHKSPNEKTKNSIGLALKSWIEKEIREKRPTWQNNPRNRKPDPQSSGPITTLYKQVCDPASAPTPAQLGAEWQLQYKLQHGPLDLFRNKTLDWRQGFFQKLGNQKWGLPLNGASAAYNTYNLTANSGSGSGQANIIAQKIVDAIVPPGQLQDEVLFLVGLAVPNFMAKLVASMVPFVGVITAGGSVLLDLKSSIQAEYQLETNRTHAERALNFGVPAAAMQAVVRALERERNAEAFSLSVSLGAFGAKLAGLLADGGTATTAAVGLAASVLKLTNIVRIVYRDVRERKAGNDLMTRSLKISAFETCPIIGAYYVCCAEDASLLNEILQRGGSPLDNLAEARFNLQKHVKPLQDQARRIIQAHRFVIPDLEARVLARTNEDADLGTVVSGWTKMAAASRPPVLRQNAMANPRH